MIYTEEGLRYWWKSLTVYDQSELLGTMLDKASTDDYRDFVMELMTKFHRHFPFSFHELSAIRKWHRD